MNKQQETKPIRKESKTLTTVKKAIAHGEATSVSSGGDIPTNPALALRHIVELFPHGELISIQSDGSEVVQTYAQIWERATSILGGLRKLGLQPGNPVIIQVGLSQDFAPAIWSCFMGGFIPLPVPIASNYHEQNQSLVKLHHAWQLLDGPVILTTSKLAPQIHTALALYNENNLSIAIVEVLEAQQPDVRLHQTQPEEMGLLLLSSGTTGKPKLVTFNCRTIVNRLIKTQPNVSELQNIIALAWLPLANISGLGNILPKLGIHKRFLVPTEYVLEKPLRWLDCIDKYNVTHTTATNFLLGLVVENLKKKTEVSWNLSSVQAIGIGAEMIVAKTVRSFLKLLAPQGLHSDVIRPSYGLSECPPIAGPGHFSLTATSDNDPFVEIGKPTPGTFIRIVDEDNHIVEEEQTGRIQVNGPNMTSGYYKSPELNQELFTSDGWIDTGDLGFLREGCLTVTGREKEVVIINALNISSVEIELAVESVEGVVPSYTAAAATRKPNSHTDELLIFFHTFITDEKRLAKLLNRIRRDIVSKFGINPTYMIPVERETIPRTTTGKMQKKQLLQRFESGEFDSVVAEIDELIQHDREEGFVAPRSPVEEILVQIWQDVLKVELIGVHENFFELGGHSLLATQVMSRVHECFGVTLPLRILFEAPTVAGMAVAITKNEQSAPTGSGAPIQPLPAGAPFALSFSQERMWFLYQFAPTSAAYNIVHAVKVAAPVNFDALEQAVNEIRRRHDVLRTVFPAKDGYPVPKLQPFTPLSIPVKDFRDCPGDTQMAQARHFVLAEANRPFDMAQGPLMRVAFLQMKDEPLIVLLTLHHIITDGWSAGIFRRELRILYEAFAAGQHSPLDKLPIQYQDFAAWQRGWLQGEVLDTQLTYWTKQLAGAPMILELPLDRPRGTMQTFNGGLHVVKLSRELTAGLKQLTQQEDATLFMAMLASLSILLGRYTASDDLLVGAPIANRHFLAIESLIGSFVNTLVLRTQLEGNPTFLELLHQVRQTTLDAYAHQDLPFEVLVDALHPPRDLSRSPVFQVMLSVLNFRQVHAEARDKPIGLVVDRQAAQFDITVTVAETPDDRNAIGWTYNSDLFERATIERMSAQFVHLLEEVTSHPDRRIHDLTLLPERERQQLLVEWNATAQPSDFPGQCVAALLEKQAVQQPESIAVLFEGQVVSYGQLNQRANQLAHYLRRLGVGTDVRVAVHCERSLDMILAVWGVVKAGGAYVPLDPTYPRERVALMLEDAGAAIVLAQQCSEYRLPPHTAKVVWMDADWTAIEQEPKHNPATEVTPDNLAYVIYTSGSTGRPKGVQIPHRALMNFLESMAREPGMDASDRLLAVTSLSFDIAGLELFLPVLVGGQIVLASREMAADGMQIIECLNTEAITVLQATPVTWQLLLAQGWSGDGRLKALCGGEAWGWELAAALLARCGSVWNMYGPTETTIWSAVRQVQAGDERVAISGPIANTQLYVLNEHLQPVPVGVPGELFIGGVGLARGYLNRPELTAERFLAEPYHANGRLYRTGDRVRYRADGSLEFLGRLDHQVKLRGYRIELGEIEAVLATQPGVKQAVVMVREDAPGDQRLVAYLMADPAPDTSELRSLARSRLPEYMVPTAWVSMDAFPLTPNRKVDRKALPAPEGSGVAFGAAYVAPSTLLEERLVRIWQDVLKIDRIGIQDNFFEVGGHSLLATQVIYRMRDTFGVNLKLRYFFEMPTIAGMAESIETLQANIEAPVLVGETGSLDRKRGKL